MDEVRHKDRVQAQFAASAEEYVRSANHATGDDLAQLAAWAEGGPERAALDVATGGGHTALVLAEQYGHVVASDLTEHMLRTAEAFIRSRGIDNVEFRAADAESLPFSDASFDAISCRIAPHHFADVGRFVAEAARVLKPGGILLLEDSVTPDDPALARFLNDAERARDSTHVRSLRARDWRDLLTEVGLTIEDEQIFRKTHPFADWLDRAHTPEPTRRELAETFRRAPSDVREAFAIVVDSGGEVVSYSDEKLALKARKGG